MKKKNHGWILWSLIVFILTCLTIHFEGTDMWMRSFIMTLISIIILVNGLTIIKNNPPQIGIVTLWGKRDWKKRNGKPVVVYVEEGWNWLFLRHLVYGIILIDVTKFEIEFEPQILVTPDGATIKVWCVMTGIPNKDHIIKYINSGAKEGLPKLLQNITEEQLRIWAQSTVTGSPQTWEELISSGPQASDILVKAITGDKNLTPHDLEQVSTGHAMITIPEFGFDLMMFNLTKMEPFGEVYEDSINKGREERQAAAELVEVKADASKAKAIVDASAGEITFAEALDGVRRYKLASEGNKDISVSAIMNVIKKSFSNPN